MTTEPSHNPLLDYVIIDAALKNEFGNKPIMYGSIKLQIRGGKVTLITAEKTIKLD